MITPLIHILLILGLMPIAYLLRRPSRLMLFAVGGAIAMLALTPGSFWAVLVTILEALVLERALRDLPKNSMWRQYLPYVLLLNMFYTDIVGALPELDLATAGVAFAVVRVFLTTKQLLGAKPLSFRHRLAALLLGGYFLPVIVIGPIVSGTVLWAQRGEAEPAHSTQELYRTMFGGWVLAALVAPWMAQLAGGDSLARPTAPLVALALFGNLFASFWGQSLIAQSGSAIAGFTVPRNFDQPWRATDFRDFWNRWHISMAKFVTQYVFLPLNLRKVPPKLATVLAFTFMGLWHQVRPGYLIWGVTHGLCMTYAPTTPATAGRSRRMVGRVTTLSTVVLLSYVANYAF